MIDLRIEKIVDEPTFRGRRAQLNDLHLSGKQEVITQASTLDGMFTDQLNGLAPASQYDKAVIFACSANEQTSSDGEALSPETSFLGYCALRSVVLPDSEPIIMRATLGIASFVVDRSHPLHLDAERSLIGAMNGYMDHESDVNAQDASFIFIDAEDLAGFDNFSSRLHGQYRWHRGDTEHLPKPTQAGINRHWNRYDWKIEKQAEPSGNTS